MEELRADGIVERGACRSSLLICIEESVDQRVGVARVISSPLHVASLQDHLCLESLILWRSNLGVVAAFPKHRAFRELNELAKDVILHTGGHLVLGEQNLSIYVRRMVCCLRVRCEVSLLFLNLGD